MTITCGPSPGSRPPPRVAGLGGRDLVVDQMASMGRPPRAACTCSKPSKSSAGGLVEHEAADLVPLAGSQVTGGVEAGALLDEAVDDPRSPASWRAPAARRARFNSPVAHVGQLHRRHDGAHGLLFDFTLHRQSASFEWLNWIWYPQRGETPHRARIGTAARRLPAWAPGYRKYDIYRKPGQLSCCRSSPTRATENIQRSRPRQPKPLPHRRNAEPQMKRLLPARYVKGATSCTRIASGNK